MSKKLGKRIKEIRKKNGMTQEEFARSLGYTSKSTINKIEEGINEMSFEKLMLLIKTYSLSLSDIMDEEK
ncbi:MAG: helix-turn-helix domain-containing protein [Bacilli bacterium]|jgi:transcriptional regulator with XRE-family HTH domain|nr:helix-turn-helix domain-containing protein [Bacilli bacterium]